jgi:hypothetical protein
VRPPLPPLVETVERGGRAGLRYNFHPGQLRAWQSRRRTVAVLAGTQGGKTSFGPLWLHREMQRCGPGDYLVVTPTYPLLRLKALPEFLRLFRRRLRLGDYSGLTRTFTVSEAGARQLFGRVPEEDTQVFFGHASDPDSLESATAKAAWLDEAGQKKFRLGSQEAIQRRLAIHQGRELITTTPYDLGWLKQQLWDPWQAGDPTIDVIRFDSTENPAYPPEEFERARAALPGWKFDLFYRALFTRPAGLIYDAFAHERHQVPRFSIPASWPRYLGLDFGGVNTAGIFLAEEPGTGKLYAYREYKAGNRTAAEHVAALLAGEPGMPFAVGGSGSEGHWRAEFAGAGLPVREPAVTGPDSVEVGIDRVYAAFRENGLLVVGDLVGLLDELGSYSRELDERGEPTEKIAAKESYHRLDGLRYVVGYVRGGARWAPAAEDPGNRSLVDQLPPGVWG